MDADEERHTRMVETDKANMARSCLRRKEEPVEGTDCYIERNKDAILESIDEISKEIPEMEKRKKESCYWKEDADGNWNTTCGQFNHIIEGTPKENHMNYCWSCGKPLVEIPYRDEFPEN